MWVQGGGEEGRGEGFGGGGGDGGGSGGDGGGGGGGDVAVSAGKEAEAAAAAAAAATAAEAATAAAATESDDSEDAYLPVGHATNGDGRPPLEDGGPSNGRFRQDNEPTDDTQWGAAPALAGPSRHAALVGQWRRVGIARRVQADQVPGMSAAFLAGAPSTE
ncbi:hypothetical protein T492DRAFT_886818 [Pavlovales sp. CCMP2436]|nr:hypothetical protein T492DRAFT_886818 [Pavlovales sp. CCMP2436]